MKLYPPNVERLALVMAVRTPPFLALKDLDEATRQMIIDGCQGIIDSIEKQRQKHTQPCDCPVCIATRRNLPHLDEWVKRVLQVRAIRAIPGRAGSTDEEIAAGLWTVELALEMYEPRWPDVWGPQ